MAGTESTPPICVFVSAQNSLLRLGLCKLLEEDDRFQTAGTASSGAEALELLSRRSFDVAVIDAAVGGMSGIELTVALRSREVALPILLISEQTSGEQAVQVLSCGATGYLTRSASPAELLDAIRRVSEGFPVLSNELGAILVPEIRRRAQASYRLTGREIDILNQLAIGGTAREIGSRLHLAQPTIKNHVAHIYAKLGVRDRGAAVAEAIRQGWLQ